MTVPLTMPKLSTEIEGRLPPGPGDPVVGCVGTAPLAGALAVGAKSQLTRPSGSRSSTTTGSTSVTLVTCTLPLISGISATLMSSDFSRAISGALAPWRLASRTPATESVGVGSRLTEMLPSIASSRPVALRTASITRGL